MTVGTVTPEQEQLTDGELWGQALGAITELQKRGWLALAIGFPIDDQFNVLDLSEDGRFTDAEVSAAVKVMNDSGGVDTVGAFEKETKAFIEERFNAAAAFREIEAEAWANPVTDAFAVTVAGDAPVSVGEIVTRQGHDELVAHYPGYTATPCTLSKRTVDAIAAAVREPSATAAGKA